MVIYIGNNSPYTKNSRWVPEDWEGLEDIAEVLVPSRKGLSPLEDLSGTFIDPFSGEQVIVERNSISRPKFLEDLNLKDSNPRSPLEKKWNFTEGTLGFSRNVSLYLNDSNIHNYVIYTGPERALYDKLFILQESTKGRYSFIKDVDSGNLYSVDKRYLRKPEISFMGASDSKIRGTKSGGFYRNKQGELIERGFTSLRAKEPLDDSGYHRFGKQTSAIRFKRNKAFR